MTLAETEEDILAWHIIILYSRYPYLSPTAIELLWKSWVIFNLGIYLFLTLSGKFSIQYYNFDEKGHGSDLRRHAFLKRRRTEP
jgi:hypothetical protein